jgi:hypothetical protein
MLHDFSLQVLFSFGSAANISVKNCRWCDLEQRLLDRDVERYTVCTVDGRKYNGNWYTI